MAERTLRDIRKERGLTLEAVAMLGDCDIATISRVERGLVQPTTQTIVRLARALGISATRMRDIVAASAEHVETTLDDRLAPYQVTQVPGR
jgi:transcriptional regulator with XRE-family HTH domain